MILAGLATLLPATEALSSHLGGPTFPAGVSPVVAIASILYALYFLLIYGPLTTRDLDRTAAWMEEVLSTGDLRKRLNLERRDVVGSIARKADKLTSSVQATIQGIADIAQQVALATQDVNAGIKISHTSAQKQSEATSSAAAAIEQVTVSIGEVAAHARATMETATHTGEVSRQGTQITKDASKTIESLADTVRQSAEQVEALGQRSEEISRVTSVIKDIADQTNLLALNAAIEAARAGETGRGFAVVADEVRKLAERTARATQEIGQMTQSIQNETQHAVDGNSPQGCGSNTSRPIRFDPISTRARSRQERRSVTAYVAAGHPDCLQETDRRSGRDRGHSQAAPPVGKKLVTFVTFPRVTLMRPIRCLAFLVLSLVFAGCGERVDREPAVAISTSPPPVVKPRVALVMKTLTNPFFVEMEKGARKAEIELGIELIVKTAAQETSFEQQVSIVEDLVQNKRADALVIAPANAHHLIPAVRKARDAGIPVVIIDARLDATQLAVADLADLPFISVDNEKGAYLAVKALSAGIEVPTTAAILEGIRSAENAQARKQGAERAFSENTAIRVVASETANWKIDEAYEVTRKMFELHPGIGLLFAANDMMALGALRYLSDNGLSSVKVAGFDALPEIRTMVDQGKLAVTVDQRSAEQGYQGVLYAIRLLKGEKVPSETLIDVELVSAPK